MTDLGGVSVPEISADLKAAILDPLALRDPVSAANPLASLSDLSSKFLNTALFSYRWGPGITPPGTLSTGALGFTPKMAFVFADIASAISHGIALSVADQEMFYTVSDFNTDYWTMSLNSLDQTIPGFSVATRILGAYRVGFAQYSGVITAFGSSGISFALTMTYKHPSYAMNMRVLVLG